MTREIGLLTMLASPLTYKTIKYLKGMGHDGIVVICEGNTPKQQVMEVLRQRAGGNVSFHSQQEIESLDVAFHTVENVNNEDSLRAIADNGCRVLGNCGIARVIREALLKACRFGVINCHPGKLPKYRGRNPVEWSLVNDDEVAATTHFMVPELDAGPIICTESLDTEGLTYHQIRAKMLPHQAKLLAKSIDLVLRNEEPPSAYPTQGDGRAWKAMPADQLDELIKSLQI